MMHLRMKYNHFILLSCYSHILSSARCYSLEVVLSIVNREWLVDYSRRNTASAARSSSSLRFLRSRTGNESLTHGATWMSWFITEGKTTDFVVDLSAKPWWSLNMPFVLFHSAASRQLIQQYEFYFRGSQVRRFPEFFHTGRAKNHHSDLGGIRNRDLWITTHVKISHLVNKMCS